MALTLDIISTVILKGKHLFADKLNEEFNNSEYSSNADKKGLRNKFTTDLYHLIRSLDFRINWNLIDNDTLNLYLELERRLGTYVDPYIQDPNYSPPSGTIIVPTGFVYDTFLKLLDTPDSYANQANKLVTVNTNETGLTFTDFSDLIQAKNGINLTNGFLQLGGIINQDYSSSIIFRDLSNEGYVFRLEDELTSAGLHIDSNTERIQVELGSQKIDFSYGSAFNLFGGDTGWTSNRQIDNNIIGLTFSSESSNGLLVYDDIGNIGLGYNNDYNVEGINHFGDRWIPDIGYIKNNLLSTFAINGLTNYTTDTIGLGGSLNRNTTVNGTTGGYFISFKTGATTADTNFTLFPGQIVWDNKSLIASNYWETKINNSNSNSLALSVAKENITGTSTLGTISFTMNGSVGTTFNDSILNLGIQYANDYSTNNSSNPRWIPDKNYVDTKVGSASIYFKANSLLGTGTNIDPFYPNAGNGLTPGDTTEGLVLGGNLDRNTTINNSTFVLTFDRGVSNTNYLAFKSSGTTEALISPSGYFRGGGFTAITGSADAEILTDTSGTLIARNQNDASVALRVAQLGNSATGDIAEFFNYARSIFSIRPSGSIIHNSLSDSTTSTVIAHNITGGLKPSNNGDTLTGLTIQPIFGSSTIDSWGTLVGGSGYPNGTKNATVTGGTGILAIGQATVSGGVITSFTLVSGGINYTVGDVLSIVITDSTGTPMGSGGTVTVATITSYSGLTKRALDIYNGPTKLAASTSSYQSLIIPAGTTYTGSTDGSLWYDGTHLYIKISGTSYQLDQQGGGGLTLTTTGTSGAATLVGSTLNIPIYSGTTYSAGTGLTLTSTTFSVNTSQNISTLSNLTSNGLIQTTGGTGALSVVTTTLPSGITGSSLTSVGTLGTLTVTAAPTFSAMTNHSVLFAGASGLLSQDNNNFYYNSTGSLLSLAVGGDFTGTNSVNIYGQFDAYEPQSSIGTITSSTIYPGVTASTSRGTGASPLINNTGDNIGGFSGWAYTGSSPAYTYMGGMSFSAVGASSSNLGGQIDFYTKADGASTTISRQTIANDGTITFSKYTAGVMQTNSSGVVSSGSLPTLTATNATLTFSGSYDGTTARTVGLNIGNSNTWTAAQNVSLATGASATYSNTLATTTAATSGNQKWSPFIAFNGSGWATGGGTSTTATGDIGLIPVQNGGGQYGQMVIRASFGSSTPTLVATFDPVTPSIISAGDLTTSSGGTVNTNAIKATTTNQNMTVQAGRTFSSSGNAILFNPGAVSNSSGTFMGISATQTLTQSSTAAYTGYQMNITETSVGSGGVKFVDYQIAGTSKFSVKDDGTINSSALTASKVVFTDASKNLTSTGIGTSSQYILGDGSLGTIGARAHNISTPTTGGTVNLTNNQYNIINPAGTLATLTVNLPSSPSNNDSVYIKYTQSITAVTYGNGTVVDGITAPTAGGLVVLVYDSGTTSWY